MERREITVRYRTGKKREYRAQIPANICGPLAYLATGAVVHTASGVVLLDAGTRQRAARAIEWLLGRTTEWGHRVYEGRYVFSQSAQDAIRDCPAAL